MNSSGAISRQSLPDIFAGVLLGTAVGDALGLPAENLSPSRIRRLWKGDWRMRLFFGRGMISDDTEHTLMVAQALLSRSDDSNAFQRSLGWKLRWWFICLPGGVGLATAKACLKLWVGFPANRAAVKSAGSGPAMRSAIIGAYFADDEKRRREFVLASSRLTHRGWQAEVAAMAIAECTALAIQTQASLTIEPVLPMLRGLSEEHEWQSWLSQIASSLSRDMSVEEFACAAGLEKGVTGYALHVVSVAIYAWLRHPKDFRNAMIGALECGGDTDTVGAILGALAGVTVGKRGIPEDWIGRVCEWPDSISFIERVAERLDRQKCSRKSLGPVHHFWPGKIPRNLLFITVVLFHGFRRLFPPY